MAVIQVVQDGEIVGSVDVEQGEVTIKVNGKFIVGFSITEEVRKESE